MKLVYKVQLFTYLSGENRQRNQEFCIKNNIVGIGWNLGTLITDNNFTEDKVEKLEKEIAFETNRERKVLKFRDEYKRIRKNERSFSTSINALIKMENAAQNGEEVICWTRCNGMFYQGVIQKDTLDVFCPNHYIHSDNKFSKIGVYIKCIWSEPITNADAPGYAVSALSQRGTTICRIHNLENLHYEELEDLLGLYLQKEKGYFIYPSTNKIGTQKYEFELIDPQKKGKMIATQCKMADKEINCNDYLSDTDKMYDEIYLTANVYKFNDKIYTGTEEIESLKKKLEKENLRIIPVEDLKKWANDEKQTNIVSDKIKNRLNQKD